MRLLSKFETQEDVKAREARQHEEDVREARIKNARSCQAWQELCPPERLCARGPENFGWNVDSDSDRIFVRYRGTAFYPKSATIIADQADLWFTVSDGEIIVYERLNRPSSWSDVVRKRPDLAKAAST